jgi:hypothetical protein
MRKLSGAASNINISAVEAVDILRTTELWDLVAGYDAEPATPPQDLPTGYITWSDVWANQYAVSTQTPHDALDGLTHLQFLQPFNIDPDILYYSEQNKQPYPFTRPFGSLDIDKDAPN